MKRKSGMHGNDLEWCVVKGGQAVQKSIMVAKDGGQYKSNHSGVQKRCNQWENGPEQGAKKRYLAMNVVQHPLVRSRYLYETRVWGVNTLENESKCSG